MVPVGIFFGRVANFINAELWGRLTDVPWAFVVPDRRTVAAPSKPSFTKPLSKGILFIVLRLLTHNFDALKKPGVVTGAFVCGYGIARIFVEFFREPDQQIGYLFGGWFTMGMLLSLPHGHRRRGARLVFRARCGKTRPSKAEMSGNALEAHLVRLIRETGPIPLSHYMALCLGHPEHGYYMTRDPLGARGDFVTAPEVESDVR